MLQDLKALTDTSTISMNRIITYLAEMLNGKLLLLCSTLFLFKSNFFCYQIRVNHTTVDFETQPKSVRLKMVIVGFSEALKFHLKLHLLPMSKLLVASFDNEIDNFFA